MVVFEIENGIVCGNATTDLCGHSFARPQALPFFPVLLCIHHLHFLLFFSRYRHSRALLAFTNPGGLPFRTGSFCCAVQLPDIVIAEASVIGHHLTHELGEKR